MSDVPALSGQSDLNRNRLYNVDVIGVLRGKYLTPAFAVKIGETAIRNCMRDQLKFLRGESLRYMGNHPMIFTEFGIPYDMDDKHAYKTGDYSSQVRAMDANHFAVEGSTANGFALWLYASRVCPHEHATSIGRRSQQPRMTTNGATSGMAKTCQFTLLTITRYPVGIILTLEKILGPSLIPNHLRTLRAELAGKTNE